MIPSPVGNLLLSAITSLVAFAIWKLSRLVYHQLRSPLRSLSGPKGPSFVYGSLGDVLQAADSLLLEEWVESYGNTFRYNGIFSMNRLFTMDLRALNHVLTHSNDYQKPFQVRYLLARAIGEGVVCVEGAQHRQQRHIMNPAFGPTQIRALTSIFIAKAIQLRDVWSLEISKDSAGTTSGAHINIVPWLSRMTLDVIGHAGFNYNFDALVVNGKPNELSEAFALMTTIATRLTLLPLLQVWIPPLRLIPDSISRKIRIAHGAMTRVGKDLLTNAKAAARAMANEKGEIEKSDLAGRDLLTLLVKANMAADIPESQRLSDKDVLAQVPTFIAAGHETTSTATTWALFALTQAPDTQTKLREELLSVNSESPSMDTLMALPYLDNIVRETLRLHPPFPVTMRIAMKDDILPFEKPFTDNNGVIHDSISIRKGDPILIPILTINRSKDLWGPDAHEFKPERWDNLPETISQIPGIWGHQLSFLEGPRACIGYRFALVEMKALLFTLVRAFEFELAVPASEIGKRFMVVQRPVLRSDPTNSVQLPLLIRPYQRA